MSVNPINPELFRENLSVPKGSKPEFDVDWFKTQIRKQNLSQRSIAKKLGINQSLISHMFFGRRRMTLEEASKWAKILDVPLIEILERSGLEGARNFLAHDEKSTCPIMGSIHDDLVIEFSPDNTLGTAANPTGQKNVGALRFETLNGPSKGLFGALLYYGLSLDYRLGLGSVDSDILGRLCVVKVKKSERYSLRVVDRGFDNGKFTLSLLNGEVREKNVALDFATPVIWIKMR